MYKFINRVKNQPKHARSQFFAFIFDVVILFILIILTIISYARTDTVPVFGTICMLLLAIVTPLGYVNWDLLCSGSSLDELLKQKRDTIREEREKNKK